VTVFIGVCPVKNFTNYVHLCFLRGATAKRRLNYTVKTIGRGSDATRWRAIAGIHHGKSIPRQGIYGRIIEGDTWIQRGS